MDCANTHGQIASQTQFALNGTDYYSVRRIPLNIADNLKYLGGGTLNYACRDQNQGDIFWQYTYSNKVTGSFPKKN